MSEINTSGDSPTANNQDQPTGIIGWLKDLYKAPAGVPGGVTQDELGDAMARTYGAYSSGFPTCDPSKESPSSQLAMKSALAVGAAEAVLPFVAVEGAGLSISAASTAVQDAFTAQGVVSGVEEMKAAHDKGESWLSADELGRAGMIALQTGTGMLGRLRGLASAASNLVRGKGEVAPEPTTEPTEKPTQIAEAPPPENTRVDSYGRTYSLNPKDTKTTVEFKYAKGSTEGSAEPAEISVGSYNDPVIQLQKGTSGEWEQTTTPGGNLNGQHEWKPLDGKVEFVRDSQGRVNSVTIEDTAGNTTYEPGSIRFTDNKGFSSVRDEKGDFTKIVYPPGQGTDGKPFPGMEVNITPADKPGMPPKEIAFSSGEKFVHHEGSMGNDYEALQGGSLGTKPGQGPAVEIPVGQYDVKVESNPRDPNHAVITIYREDHALTGPYRELSSRGVREIYFDADGRTTSTPPTR